MKRLLSVSVTAGSDATGRIAALACLGAMDAGMEVLLAYGRGEPPVGLPGFCIANRASTLFHGLATRLADGHGLASKIATRRLIRKIEQFRPDVIHLHNIHGYYLNYPDLFKYLARTGIPTVWTLHDCWAMTGHCAYFHGCRGWLEGCHGQCPSRRDYPSSLLVSASARNYSLKDRYFNLPGLNLTLVGVSEWTSEMARMSLLGKHPVVTIPNGVDTTVFRPRGAEGGERPVLLGVARVWDSRKGPDDFMRLAAELPPEWRIRLIGVGEHMKRRLPSRIEAVPYISEPSELAAEYSRSTVFANLTYADMCPLTQLEALACGTPVVAYASGGAPESVDPSCGRVLEAGAEASELVRAIEEAASLSRTACRARVEEHYSLQAMQRAYVDLYGRLAR